MQGNNEQSAQLLISLFIDKVKAKFKERVVSVHKIGSLGCHGDFSQCSDVDVALMLDVVKESDYSDIKMLWDEIKALNMEYADRLSIFWSCYDNNVFSCGKGRFPALDRADFLQFGVLLFGTDKRQQLTAPTHQLILQESADFVSTYMLAGDKFNELVSNVEVIASKGARYFSKFILFPVRLIFTIANPNIIGSNRDAVEYFNRELKEIMPEVLELITQAYLSRNTPPQQPVTTNITKLEIRLPQLYRFCIQLYYCMLQLQAQDILAVKLSVEILRIDAALADNTDYKKFVEQIENIITLKYAFLFKEWLKNKLTTPKLTNATQVFFKKLSNNSAPEPLTKDNIANRRPGIKGFFLSFAARPRNDVNISEKNIPGYEGYSVLTRIFKPKGLENCNEIPTLIYFPGNGFIFDLDGMHDGPCAEIAFHSGAQVILVTGTRLGPENRYPIGFYDAKNVFEEILHNPINYQVDLKCLFIGGDSSGGNYAVKISYDYGQQIKGLFLVSPHIDLDGKSINEAGEEIRTAQTLDAMINREAVKTFDCLYIPPNTALVSPEYSPLYADFAAKKSQFPQTHVIIPECDGNRGESEALIKKLQNTGMTVTRTLIHGLPHNGMICRGENAITDGENPAVVLGELLKGQIVVNNSLNTKTNHARCS